MGRPLRKDVLETIGLVASGKVLGAQCGFNKYLVKDTDEVVTLSDKEDLENGMVVLTVKGQPVLKILRNIMQLKDGFVSYQLNDEGKVVIDGEVLTFGEASTEEVKEPVEEEAEESEEKAEEEVVEEPSDEEVVEEPSEEVVSE
jgi:hypothetical protein